MRQFLKPQPTFAAILLMLLLFYSCMPHLANADPLPPQLVISQAKITGSNGQFLTLYNATNQALDMSKFQLEYFNSYDLTKATSSKLISLTGSLPAHGYYMVNDGALLLCYQLLVNAASLDFSSTAGMVEVVGNSQSAAGSPVLPVLQDYFAWSKTVATGAQLLPSSTSAFLLRQPVDSQHNPSAITPGSGTWLAVQQDPSNACNLTTVPTSGTSTTPVLTGLNQLLPTVEPAATIIALSTDAAAATPVAALPAADIGLMTPQVTELLPNPNGTGNDATDEFIELYNPNRQAFDLTGFSLIAGTSTTHAYQFPSGSSLAPNSFTALYASSTKLSLSNSEGQVVLTDPFGNSLSASEAYGTAKDGQTWALANGKWYWTTKATPNAANIIDQPVASKSASAKSASSTTSKTTTKGALTAKSSKTAAAKSSAASSSASTAAAMTTPIHPWMLALVASLALLYGAYEYRADLANRIFELRRYLSTRFQARRALARR